MLKRNLVVAFRSLRRHKGTTALNVAGLAVGVAACLLIGLYVLDELSFDRFQPDAEQTFRVVETRAVPDLGDQQAAGAPGPVGPALADMPGVRVSTRLYNAWRFTVSRGGQNAVYVGDYLIAEPSFFAVFGGFELLQGDPATALSAPNTVVLTETTARSYFGAEDPMGQTLDLDGEPATVTGVLRDPPATSHLAFSMLIPEATLAQEDWWTEFYTAWSTDEPTVLTYAVLDDAAAAPAVEARLEALVAEHAEANGPSRSLALQPLTDVHFGSGEIEESFNRAKQPVAYVLVFGALAAFLLAIACINYMNLATARAMERAREIGVRKALGSSRAQLVAQFLSESVLLAVAAVALAVGLAALALPAFNGLAGKSLTLVPDGAALSLVAFVALALVVGLLAGSYPALFLSGFRPARALRGAPVSGGRLRRGLVIVQFALSIGMITATLTVADQVRFIQQAPLGYEAEHLVSVDINSGDVRRAFRAMRAEMEALPSVRSVSVTTRLPGDWKGIAELEAVPEGASEPRTLAFFGADDRFLETFGVALAAGRNFDPARPADSSSVLLNETAVRALGFSDPLGQRVVIPDELPNGDGTFHDAVFTVVGVVRDFHFRSLHEPIRPLAIGAWDNPIQSIDYFTARIDAAGVPATMDALRRVGESFDSENPFEANVLDARLAEFYTAEERTARVVGVASGLAVFLACLGLLGLAAFVAQQRRREIGVRKVLGATVPSLVALLTRDFAALVAVAFVVAAPLAWLGLSRWLSGFAYHVGLGPAVFVLAGAGVLAVALVTVGTQALRAATADPVRALRSE